MTAAHPAQAGSAANRLRPYTARQPAAVASSRSINAPTIRFPETSGRVTGCAARACCAVKISNAFCRLSCAVALTVRSYGRSGAGFSPVCFSLPVSSSAPLRTGPGSPGRPENAGHTRRPSNASNSLFPRRSFLVPSLAARFPLSAPIRAAPGKADFRRHPPRLFRASVPSPVAVSALSYACIFVHLYT